MNRTMCGYLKLSSAFSVGLALMLTVGGVIIKQPLSVVAQSIPERWQAEEYQPPGNLGSPTSVDQGGTRGSRITSQNYINQPIALVPTTSNHFGVTVNPHPHFLVYLPGSSNSQDTQQVEFRLEDGETGEEIYTSTFKRSAPAGIVTIALPAEAGLLPLEVNKVYHWSLAIADDLQENKAEAEGWIKRVTLQDSLSRQLQQASPQEQARLYAEAEIWYDSVAKLAQVYRSAPNDLALASDWEKLLKAAGLEQLVQVSLVRSSLTSAQR
ncbi:MAG: DUF928 domain-containing protein [Oscillatoria sp. PMC 1068.18]|nr:DUF928 domain-containing protein [Oscillatoria sp. PMC 1076.18]MEC4990667.1 DUF928 domain-containing protein [Oscillatoria sp. PMC 1068.18]